MKRKTFLASVDTLAETTGILVSTIRMMVEAETKRGNVNRAFFWQDALALAERQGRG